LRGAEPIGCPPAPMTASNEAVFDGQCAFARNCPGCHGVNAVADKTIPALRYASRLDSAQPWNDVVLAGARREKGWCRSADVWPMGNPRRSWPR